jgi:hypothetical protein
MTVSGDATLGDPSAAVPDDEPDPATTGPSASESVENENWPSLQGT